MLSDAMFCDTPCGFACGLFECYFFECVVVRL